MRHIYAVVVGIEELQAAHPSGVGVPAEPQRVAGVGVRRGSRIGDTKMPSRHPRGGANQNCLLRLRQRQRLVLRLEGQRPARHLHPHSKATRTPPRQRLSQREVPHLSKRAFLSRECLSHGEPPKCSIRQQATETGVRCQDGIVGPQSRSTMLGLTMSLGLTAVTRNVRHFQPTGVPVTDPSLPTFGPLAGTTHAEPL